MPDKNGKTTLPYVPFKTFNATLDSFAGFLPDRIDTSIWTSYSGGMRSQLLSAYKFFGLVNEDGSHNAELKKLADAKDDRGPLLREIMKRSYGELLKLDLSKATPSSFDAEMRKIGGLEGDTHRKAIAFFLSAAKFSGIPLSPLIVARGGLSTTRTKSTPRPKREGDGAKPPSLNSPGANLGVSVKTVTLENGITLTLTASADVFSMTKSDRQWVLGVLDLLDKYEEDHPHEEGDDEEAVE